MEEPTMDDLRIAFDRAMRRRRFNGYRPGLMGRWDGGAVYTFTVPGGLGYTYVRIIQGEVVTLAQALNRAGIPNTADYPIWLDSGPDGRLEIVGRRYVGT